MRINYKLSSALNSQIIIPLQAPFSPKGVSLDDKRPSLAYIYKPSRSVKLIRTCSTFCFGLNGLLCFWQ